MSRARTDWTKYYASPTKLSEFTRKISRNKIHNLISRHTNTDLKSICELGGANSCFIDSFLVAEELENYHVVDNNNFGLQLLEKRYSENSTVTYEKADILVLENARIKYELVYSIGLIEHFLAEDTKKSIATHFSLCKPDGLVLIAFPTPTFLYRIIRSVAECVGLWSFPDERPLLFNEVLAACRDCGAEVLHTSINWKIGLTQGYVLAKNKE